MLRTTLMALAALGAAFAMAQDFQGGPPQGQGGGPGWQGGPPPAGPQGGGMQRGGMRGGPMMGMAGPRILMRPDVQKELKLTEDQKKQLGELMPPEGPGGRGGFGGPGGPGGRGGQNGGGQGRGGDGQGFPPPPDQGGFGQGGPGQGGPGQGQQGGQGFPPPPDQGGFGQGGPGQGGPGQGGRGFGGPGQRGPGGPDMREMEAKIQKILTDSQYKRYQELSLQLQGAGAVARPDVAEKLGLSEDQIKQIRDIQMNDRPPRPERGQNDGPPDFQQMREQMKKHREEMEGKIMAVLTGSQKSKWQVMLGKPFKFDETIPMGPGGFGGPGGPGGPGGGFGGPGGGGRGGQRGGGGGGFGGGDGF